MANELARTASNLPAQGDIDPFQKLADETASRAHIVGNLLRFSKHGEWKAGQEQDEVPEGTRLLAYLPGLKLGWVKWEENAPTKHLLGLVSEGAFPCPREELGDLDESEWRDLNGQKIDPWQKTFYLVLLDENGEFYTYVTASKGGASAIGVVADRYAKRHRMKPDEIPIVELHSRSYDHKQYGETFAPDLRITGWSKIPENFDELQSAMQEEESGSDETVEFAAPKALPRASAPTPAAKSKVVAKGKAPAKVVATQGKKKNGPSKTVRF
jgi:hypothetical protein